MMICSLFGRVIEMGVQLAAPPFVAILMTDLFLGIINRLAPQVQIAFLGLSLKSLVACIVLFFGWIVIMKTTLAEAQHWMGLVYSMMQMWKAS
jgi:type III secretory pathway component EscT